ncbi:MAG: hypothetical protein ACLTSG_02915 [Lachnospiraceae bacterium]
MAQRAFGVGVVAARRLQQESVRVRGQQLVQLAGRVKILRRQLYAAAELLRAGQGLQDAYAGYA